MPKQLKKTLNFFLISTSPLQIKLQIQLWIQIVLISMCIINVSNLALNLWSREDFKGIWGQVWYTMKILTRIQNINNATYVSVNFQFMEHCKDTQIIDILMRNRTIALSVTTWVLKKPHCPGTWAFTQEEYRINAITAHILLVINTSLEGIWGHIPGKSHISVTFVKRDLQKKMC